MWNRTLSSAGRSAEVEGTLHTLLTETLLTLCLLRPRLVELLLLGRSGNS